MLEFSNIVNIYSNRVGIECRILPLHRKFHSRLLTWQARASFFGKLGSSGYLEVHHFAVKISNGSVLFRRQVHLPCRCLVSRDPDAQVMTMCVQCKR